MRSNLGRALARIYALLATSLAIGMLAAGALVIGTLPVTASGNGVGENLLTNPGFEIVNENGQPQGWGRSSVPDGGQAGLSVTDVAHTGARSALMDADAVVKAVGQTARVRYFQSLGPVFESGATYRVSAWYKTEGSPRARLQVAIYKPQEGPPPYEIASINTGDLPPAEDWQYVERTFTFPENGRTANVVLWTYYGTDGRVWFDDVALTRITEDEVDASMNPTSGEGSHSLEGAAHPPQERAAREYYVSPDGSDQNDGSRERPWATLEKASMEARAGDTVILLPGKYAGTIRPEHSGTPENPITFRAAERLQATLIGNPSGVQGNLPHAVQLVNVSHIIVEGLRIEPQNPQIGRWVYVRNSDHITLSDLHMRGTEGGAWGNESPFLIESSDHVSLLNSVVTEHEGQQLINVYRSKHLLFEGNTIGHAGHSPLALSPAVENWSSNANIVLRANVFDAGWGRAYEIFSEPNVLVEGNIIIHSFHGGQSASSETKWHMQRGIARFNRVFRNWGFRAIAVSPYHVDGKLLGASHMRIYHNVFDANDAEAIELSTNLVDVILKNNIFSRNDPYGSGNQLAFNVVDTTLRFVGNLFDGPVSRSGFTLDVATMQTKEWQDRLGEQFSGNLSGSPGFRDPATFDHRLTPGSAALDAAQPLTRTTAGGEGTAIPVEDALYFYDGFGIKGEQGDLIAVGDAERVARVLRVDTESHTLHIDRPLSWREGEPVSLAWAGSAPDIGAYEHGDQGRVSISIQSSAFLVRPGDVVRLQADVHGDIDPVSYEWRISDGTLLQGPAVTHRFDFEPRYPNSPGGFSVHLRVTGADGRSYVAAGYLEMDVRSDRGEPLLHTTFDRDDENWWWIWYKNRPTPVDWEQQLNPQTGQGVLRIGGPGVLPLMTHPAQWNIDDYPIVYLRYRIAPGTPVGLYLQGFPAGSSERKMYVAATRSQSNRPATARQVLVDDGEWHTIVFDARLIRELYPDVNVLQRLGMEALSPVQAGAAYWLDEAAILPEKLAQTPAWEARLASQHPGHIEVPGIAEGAVVRGELPVRIRVERYLDHRGEPVSFEVDLVDIALDGETLLTAGSLEAADGFTLDTLAVPDGRHTLTVRLVDAAGRSLQREIPFTVKNWQTLKDRLDPPEVVSFFGQEMVVDHSLTASESPGWEYAGDGPLFGDRGRRVKSSSSAEHLVWNAPGLKAFRVAVYTRVEDVRDVVTLAVSRGGDQWQALPFGVEVVESTPDGWRHVVLLGEGGVLSGESAGFSGESAGLDGTLAFRVQVGENAGPGELQIGDVELTVRAQ